MVRRRLRTWEWSTTDFLAVVVTLAAPAMGGSTQLWAQTLLLGAAAALVLADTPASGPRGPWWVAGVGLLLIGGVQFLPASWLTDFSWRATLLKFLEIPLGNTLTVQPWLSLEMYLVLGGCLLWIAFLTSREWTMPRAELLMIYAGGMALLVSLALILHLAGVSVALWKPQNGGFGFFPNRNQMGNLMALGGVVTLALAFRSFQHRHRMRFFWPLAYGVLAIGLLVNYSRAGIVLFFVGSFTWLVWVHWRSRQSVAPAVGSAVVLALLMTGLLYGGATVERFMRPLVAKTAVSEDFRFKVQVDAVHLLRESSWHGIGLGNFDAIFARYRDASKADNRVIHPESDWLWLGIEMGWLAPLLIWMAAGWWFWRCWPSSREPDFELRAALAVGTVLFLVHGFIDVSGHRLGALWPVLLFGALLARSSHETRLFPSVRGQWGYRVAALVLLAPVGWWAASVSGARVWPTSEMFSRAREQIGRAAKMEDLVLVGARATEALRYAPLHWQIYYYRGKAALLSGGPVQDARFDLTRARWLEPLQLSFPVEEGELWMLRVPKYALPAWSDAIHRALTPESRAQAYQRMLQVAQSNAEIRAELIPIAYGDSDLLMTFLDFATPKEFAIEVDKLFLASPKLESLSVGQKRRLFTVWADRGDQKALVKCLDENPQWQAEGWLGYVRALGSFGESRRASEYADRFVPKPVLPPPSAVRPKEEWEKRLVLNADDFVAGYALYEEATRSGNAAGALLILERLAAVKGCPSYFYYLLAKVAMEREAWDKAWQAWSRYLELR